MSQLSSGTVWRSERPALETMSYDTLIPPGLHIGIGTARLHSHAQGLGGFEANGPALTVIRLANECLPMATTIRRGPACATGLYIDFTGTDHAMTDHHELILAAMDSHELRAATSGAPVARALRLLAPIDPWFQGSVRDLVLEGRGLELLAIARTWLSGKGEDPVLSQHQRKATVAREYIEAHLAEPLTLDAIARAVGVNVRTLTDAFRQHFGLGIAAYLTDRRMKVAMQMLMEGVSVSCAAYAVGYQPNGFSTAFRRQFGYPPSAISRVKTRVGQLPASEEETPAEEDQ